MSKVTGNNRVSALKRLSKPSPINNMNRGSLVGSKNALIKDARQLLGNRNKPSFDARQILSRPSSKTFDTAPKNLIVRKNLLQNNAEIDHDNEKMVVITGLTNMKMKDGQLIPTAATIGGTQAEKKKNIFAVGSSTFVTIRNGSNNNNISSNQSTEKISLTKTITNTSARFESDDRRLQTTNTLSSSDQTLVLSFVNDKYQRNPSPPQPTTTITKSSASLIHRRASPPMIKRLHDASIQTTPSSSSSRSPIRMNSHRRHNSIIMDEHEHLTERTIGDDLYEPPVKRTTSSTRKTTTDREQQVQPTPMPTGSVKRTSTGAPVSSRISSSVSTVSKQLPTTQSNSTSGTILVTNLQSSVTEEDVIELFGQIGRINEITTLSQGCVQIVYAKREHSEQAVTKYHNRLLDGQFMYVSLQQQQPSSSYSTTQNSKPTSSIQQPTKDNETSASSSSATNQPLKFNATNNSSNKTVLDPSFFRQALFHPSNNSTNPVQFQVKL